MPSKKAAVRYLPQFRDAAKTVSSHDPLPKPGSKSSTQFRTLTVHDQHDHLSRKTLAESTANVTKGEARLCIQLFDRNLKAFIDKLLTPHVLSALLHHARNLHSSCSDSQSQLQIGAAAVCCEAAAACMRNMVAAARKAESSWTDEGTLQNAALPKVFDTFVTAFHRAAHVTSDWSKPVAAAVDDGDDGIEELSTSAGPHFDACNRVEVGKGHASFSGMFTSKIQSVHVKDGGVAIVVGEQSLQSVRVDGEGSRLMLIGCRISQHGVKVTQRAKCVLLGCTVQSCRDAGISVFSRARLTCFASSISQPSGDGVRVWANCEAVLIGSFISAAKGNRGNGVLAVDCMLEAQHLTISKQGAAALHLDGSTARAQLSFCHIHNNRSDGILVSSGASLQIHDSKVHRSGGTGIVSRDRENGQLSSVKLRNCICSENRNGVAALNGGSLDLRPCAVLGNQVAGLLVSGKGSNVVCHVIQADNNLQYGVHVANGATGAMHTGCVENNKGNGIHVEGKDTRLSAVHVKVQNNSGSGLFVDCASADFAECEMSCNVQHGAEAVGGSAFIRCQGCRCCRNKGCGFAVRDGAELVMIDGCVSKRNQSYGLLSSGLWSTAWPYNYWSYDKLGKASKQNGGEIQPCVAKLVDKRSMQSECKLGKQTVMFDRRWVSCESCSPWMARVYIVQLSSRFDQTLKEYFNTRSKPARHGHWRFVADDLLLCVRDRPTLVKFVAAIETIKMQWVG